MSLDDAAAVFDAQISGGKPAGSSGGAKEVSSRPEEIFGNSGTHEDDLIAGGDDKLTQEEIDAAEEAKARKSREQDVEDDEDESYFLDEDEDEDDDESDDNADDEDDEDEDDELMNQKFTVMVDGEEEEVTVKDALDGIIRTKTLHKRLNELNGFRDELGKHAQRIVDDRERYDTMLEEAEEIMKGLIPDEPDWDKLFEEDPKNARELQKQFQGFQAKVDEIREKRKKAQSDLQEQANKDKAEFARNEFPKFASYAKWKDDEAMQKDLKSMRKTALSTGFSEQEIAEVLDSRMLTILHKASKFDRMMAARPRAQKKGKGSVKPGAGSNRTARRGVREAQKNLAKTGSIDDAANVFGQIISNTRRR